MKRVENGRGGGRLLFQDLLPTLPFVSDLGTWLGVLSGNSACLGLESSLLWWWVAICAGGAPVASAKSAGVPGHQTVLCYKTNRSREDGGHVLPSHITTSCLKELEVLWYGLLVSPHVCPCVSLSFTQVLRRPKS